MSPQKEVTDKRPSNYSAWHRANLPDWCYHTDGDWFQQRLIDGRLIAVAYIETLEVPPLLINSAQREYELWPSKKALMADIYQRTGMPCFVVRHTPDCKVFSVAQTMSTGDETEAVVMDETKYIHWLLSLG